MYHKKGLIELCKAQVSASLATLSDFLTTAVVFQLSRHVMGSTAAGAILGGIINCCINYRWTFQGTGRTKKSIFWRYLLVWIGSILLNTFGTDYAVRLCEGFTDSNTLIVIICKAIVAIIVALGWNFVMQKYYVFKKPHPSSPKGRCLECMKAEKN